MMSFHMNLYNKFGEKIPLAVQQLMEDNIKNLRVFFIIIGQMLIVQVIYFFDLYIMQATDHFE